MVLVGIVLAVGLAMMAVEAPRPGRSWPAVRGWWLRAIALNGGQVASVWLAELVYHWNVRTPYWLGFVFQRPESHCVHHQAGVHAWNYSDLPLWDMLFGTFRNPRAWAERCGFGEGEHRLVEMLWGVDVNVDVNRPHSDVTIA